jgi:hypothetical protein
MAALQSAQGFVVTGSMDLGLSETPINFANTGDNTIITGTTGKAIYVYKYFLVVAAATSLTFKDGATVLTGLISLTANEAMVFTFDTRPWYSCSSGNNFIINASNNTQVSGRAYYIIQ